MRVHVYVFIYFKQLGVIDANRRPEPSELLELCKSVDVHRNWHHIAHLLGMDKSRVAVIGSSHENVQEQAYGALCECVENPQVEITFVRLCYVLEHQCGRHLQDILRAAIRLLWWLSAAMRYMKD